MIVTIERSGEIPSAAAVKLGTRPSAAFSLTTGERVRQPATRSAIVPGTDPESISERVRFGSALERTTLERSSSPLSSRTP